MSSPTRDTSRALALLLILGVVVVATVVVLLVRARGSDEPSPSEDAEHGRPARPATRLCEVVAGALPPELGLGAGRQHVDTGSADVVRTRCTVGSAGAAELEVTVSSYAVPTEEDGEERRAALGKLVSTTCAGVEEQLPVEFSDDRHGCSGRDSAEVTMAVPVHAAMVSSLAPEHAIVEVRLSDTRLPAQASAYTSAITYAVVAGEGGLG